ncbi:hypothetical protein FRB91_006787 [Serendipita sp. 411]|nr:hypothetical protein FRB91_006787 [Serendipita sp. 411]
MAATSVASTSSSFATLLKQSKFASYSPAIAQVYTTYGGHAFRGDWGLKRPLSVRKSGRALLIHSIDSPQQQTEFRSGEPETRMVKRWNETGVDVGVHEDTEIGSWRLHYSNRPTSRGDLAIDSEFSTYNAEPDQNAGAASRNLALGIRTPPSTEATPNVNAMSQKEFNKYLEKIRKLRPAFRQYIEEKDIQYGRSQNQEEAAEERSREETGLFYMRKKRGVNDMAHNFLNEMAYQLHGDANSQVLEPYPHRNGGLFYPSHNVFQTGLLYKPIKSHVTSTRQRVVSSSAGMTVHLPHFNNEGVSPLDWSRQNLISGEAPIRVSKAVLLNPPEVVTTLRSPASKLSYSAPPASILRKRNLDLTTPPFTYPMGLKSMTMGVEGVTTVEDKRTNKWPPGSVSYSVEPPDRTIVKTGPQAPPQSRVAVNLGNIGFQRNQVEDRKIRDNLTSLLDRMPSVAGKKESGKKGSTEEP